jgi:hypothetical protein
MPRTTIPGHTKLLFEEHPGNCKISVGLLSELSSRFQSEPIVALQDRLLYMSPHYYICVLILLLNVSSTTTFRGH